MILPQGTIAIYYAGLSAESAEMIATRFTKITGHAANAGLADHPIANAYQVHFGPDFHDLARPFMAQNNGVVCDSGGIFRVVAAENLQVGAAYPDGLNADYGLGRTDLGTRLVNNSAIARAEGAQSFQCVGFTSRRAGPTQTARSPV